ncbi:MAG: isoleucine--tRNA ligase [Capsulimonadaceae bacterium]
MSATEKKNYGASLNVPSPDVKGDGGIDTNPTSIPQRANLPKREPGILQFWRDNHVYEQSLTTNCEKGTFILHDGPPFSNGNIHIGHAFNKILKDVIVKSRSMQGYSAPYIPGWDNNGLPIEVLVAKEFREKKVVPTRTELRARCREVAAYWVEKQSEQFQRLGIGGDWAHPYLTATPAMAAREIEGFATMVDKNYIYRGLRPVYWSLVDETALADAEIEYEDRDDPSIHVRFPLQADPDQRFDGVPADRCYTVIWTTTPWTIPANVAVAVGPAIEYVIAAVGDDRYLVAADRLDATMAAAGYADYRVVSTFAGNELAGLVFRHPLFDRTAPVVLAGYVTTSDGTGVVHTAPGQGKDDFITGQKYNLPVLQVLTGNGYFNEQAGAEFAGLRKDVGEKKVLERLTETGALIAIETIRHSYPHGWRSHDPLVFRATEQWFVNIDSAGHRERCLDEIDRVKWYPGDSVNRIRAMVAGRPDWCISRQRHWGIGIPVFYAQPSGTPLLTRESVLWVRDLVAKGGTDAWFETDAADIIPAGFAHPQTGETEFTKETDIFDVWFDSGSTNQTVLTQWPGLSYPSDVYLEGGDQHRGWFNSSLMVGVAVTGSAPYRQVITNGWTLDETGKKLSKSKLNGVAPSVVTEKFGADVLRLWVCSTDYFADVRVGDIVLDQVATSYRTLRNTLRFTLGNLTAAGPDDFEPARDTVAYADLPEIDRWALHRLSEVVRTSLAGYEEYEFQRISQAVLAYCTTDLSAFYLDVLKDRLYTFRVDAPERRAAQTVLYEITSVLTRLLAPILSFTAEEIWQKLPGAARPISVLLSRLPEVKPEHTDEELAARWAVILDVRDEVNKVLEGVKSRREFAITLTVDGGTFASLMPYLYQLPSVLMVSAVSLVCGEEPGVQVRMDGPASGVKCARCWVGVSDGGDDPAADCASGCRRVWRVEESGGVSTARRLLPE